MIDPQLEDLRKRAIALLQSERRTFLTGELAMRLDVPTHRLHLALHGPAQLGQVYFDATGWSAPPQDRPRPTFDENQTRIGDGSY